MQQGDHCEVIAIASRSADKAKQAAEQLGIPNSYDSYEALLADPNVDAIYNPAGQIGELRTVNSFFSYFNNDADNIRNQADIGGGALMDIGCYPISLSRFLFEAEPTKVLSTVEYDPNLKVDRLSSAILQFEGGTATFTCSTQLHPYQRVHAYGTHGHLEIQIPFNAPPGEQCQLWIHQSDAGNPVADRKEILVEACDQYTIQGDLFARHASTHAHRRRRGQHESHRSHRRGGEVKVA